MSKAIIVDNKERYQKLLVGPIERFDQRSDMFRKAKYDPGWMERSTPFYAHDRARDEAGYTQEYYALADAAWYLEHFFAMGTQGANHQGLYAWESFDPDTSRIWWEDVGVHQNLTHAVHPDPISGAHCWLQKAVNVTKAGPEDRHGDVWVDTNRSMEIYRQWVALTRSAVDVSPDGTRRPHWLKRPLKPIAEAYKLPEKPFGR